MEYVIIVICIIIIIPILWFLVYMLYDKIKHPDSKPTIYEKQAMRHITHDGQVFCPQCRSTQISANKKGLSLATGLIGSQTVYITCLSCGHRWKAGQ